MAARRRGGDELDNGDEHVAAPVLEDEHTVSTTPTRQLAAAARHTRIVHFHHTHGCFRAFLHVCSSDKRRLLPRPPPPLLPLQPQLQLLPHRLHDPLTIASAWKVHPLT